MQTSALSLSKYRQIKPIHYVCPEAKKKKKGLEFGVYQLQ